MPDNGIIDVLKGTSITERRNTQYNVSLIDFGFLSDGFARFFDTVNQFTSPVLDEVKDYWWLILLAFFAYKMRNE